MGIIEKVLAQTGSTTTYQTNELALTLWGSGGAFNQNALIGKIISWVLIIAGIVAFFYLVYAGFTYLTAGGNPEAAKKGQQGIINAIIGIVIIVLSWAIIRFVAGVFK